MSIVERIRKLPFNREVCRRHFDVGGEMRAKKELMRVIVGKRRDILTKVLVEDSC